MNDMNFKKPQQADKKNPDGTPAPQQEMSKGEKWYNWLVYTGMNYWMNLGISLFITDVFLHGKGKQFFHDGVASATQKLTNATGMSRANAKWLSEVGLGTFSLNSGGNILLIPTKFLEDAKRPIVYWLNEKLGVDQTAPDGHKQKVDEIYIEQEQDPQSWPRMIGRRVLGWMASTSVGLTLDRVLAQKLATPIMVDGEMVTKKLGQKVYTDATQNVVNSTLDAVGGSALVKSPMFQRYTSYAALDWIYTIITSKILHATNGAHKEKMPHEIGENGNGDTEVKEAKPEQAAPVSASQEAPRETVIMPSGKNASDIVRSKDKDEGFTAAIARQSEAGATLQVGA